MLKPFFVFLATAALALVSCTDATVIGGELVDGTQLPVTITDTVALEFRSVSTKQFLASRFLNDASVPVGCLETDATGRLNSRLGIELVESVNPRLSLDAITIDSIVLILPVLPAVQVGDTTASTSLVVRPASAGTIRFDEATDQTPLEAGTAIYGTYEGLVPRRIGTVNTFVGDTVRIDSVGPQIRIPLNGTFLADARQALSRRTAADTTKQDTLFVEAFPGLVIEGGAACAKTIPAVNLLTSAQSQLGVTIYYQQDGARRQYRLINRRVQGNGNAAPTLVGYPRLRAQYDRDFSGSLLERLRAGGPIADSFAVVQALGGSNVEVTFPNLSAFRVNRGVTFAELEVPIVPGSDDRIPALRSLVIQLENASGDLEDYSVFASQTTTPAVFNVAEGGFLTKIIDPNGGTDSVSVYRFNITSLFQEFVSGRRDAKLFLVPRSAEEVGGEAILLGPRSEPLRARLRIASTLLP